MKYRNGEKIYKYELQSYIGGALQQVFPLILILVRYFAVKVEKPQEITESKESLK